MSSAYTATARMTKATAEHHQFVVIGRDGVATRPPLTSYLPTERTRNILAPPKRSATCQRYTDLTQPRRGGESPPPPPFLPVKTIPLPALADIPISVHPLLTYTPSKVVLEYDLSMPPSTARLSPTIKACINSRGWREQPAMNPSTVGSMTIGVPGLNRVVVVFPATLDSRVVTIGDVLDAVYCAMRDSVTDKQDDALEGQRNAPALGEIDPSWSAYMAIAIRKHIGEKHQWAGLYPCQTERDVWCLRTRRVGRR